MEKRYRIIFIIDPKYIKNKEERYSPVSRLSDTRYSAKGTKGKWSTIRYPLLS